MRLSIAFWRSMAVWTLLIVVLLLAISALTGAGGDILAGVPVWIGLAFVLAAYPAAITVADDVFPAREVDLARAGVFAAVTASASAATFILANVVAPMLLSGSAGPGLIDGTSMTLGEVLAELRVLGEQARRGPATAENWLPFNHLAYQFVRRTDGMLLPALFAWVGLFVGFWSNRLHRHELRRTAQWGMGAVLLISTYFAGENGYEMILTRIGGPAEFVGDLVLIVPGTLIIGLGLATLISVLPVTLDESTE